MAAPDNTKARGNTFPDFSSGVFPDFSSGEGGGGAGVDPEVGEISLIRAQSWATPKWKEPCKK